MEQRSQPVMDISWYVKKISYYGQAERVRVCLAFRNNSTIHKYHPKSTVLYQRGIGCLNTHTTCREKIPARFVMDLGLKSVGVSRR